MIMLKKSLSQHSKKYLQKSAKEKQNKKERKEKHSKINPLPNLLAKQSTIVDH